MLPSLLELGLNKVTCPSPPCCSHRRSRCEYFSARERNSRNPKPYIPHTQPKRSRLSHKLQDRHMSYAHGWPRPTEMCQKLKTQGLAVSGFITFRGSARCSYHKGVLRPCLDPVSQPRVLWDSGSCSWRGWKQYDSNLPLINGLGFLLSRRWIGSGRGDCKRMGKEERGGGGGGTGGTAGGK